MILSLQGRFSEETIKGEFSFPASHESQRISYHAALRSAFKAKDKDNTGTLNSAELRDCLMLVGLIATDEDIDFLSKHFDDNGEPFYLHFWSHKYQNNCIPLRK